MEGMRSLTSRNMLPRSTLLKALEKSRRRVQRSSGWMLVSSCTCATACTMASQPTGTPTPTCKGVRTSKGYKRYQIYHAQKVQNVAVHRGDTDSFYDIVRAAVMPSQRQDREYKTAVAIHRNLQNRSSLEAVLGMAATTFHGNSVGIEEITDLTPPEKSKLQTRVLADCNRPLFMDTKPLVLQGWVFW